MELEDCAFPLVTKLISTTNPEEGFRGANWALLVGSVPRKQGMERKDLLGINGKIFTGQGRARLRPSRGGRGSLGFGLKPLEGVICCPSFQSTVSSIGRASDS